jgi:esterase
MHMSMERRNFESGSLTLSYLDAGGKGEPIIGLHAHWMEAQTFMPLADSLKPWRVIALDQRGHGYSDHASSYTRDDYLRDLAALYAHLGLRRAILLGNSLGGVNAYQFAARHPDRVRALVIEDIGAVVKDDISFVLKWTGTFEARQQLEEVVGPRFLPYLKDSFREGPDGWRLAFDPKEMLESQRCLLGDHWKDWLGSCCPALLIRGEESRVTSQAHLEEMTARRPNTICRHLPGGHVVHLDSPEAFTHAVRDLLVECAGSD